jgi:hypothetical protein
MIVSWRIPFVKQERSIYLCGLDLLGRFPCARRLGKMSWARQRQPKKLRRKPLRSASPPGISHTGSSAISQG